MKRKQMRWDGLNSESAFLKVKNLVSALRDWTEISFSVSMAFVQL